jgi:hypothetical protein
MTMHMQSEKGSIRAGGALSGQTRSSVQALRGLAAALAFVALAALFPAVASAAGPAWDVDARSYPTNLPPGGMGLAEVVITNLAAVQSNGDISVRYELPDGVIARRPPPNPLNGYRPPTAGDGYLWSCAEADGMSTVECTYSAETYFGPAKPFGTVTPLLINVYAAPNASGVRTGSLVVSGGGAEPVHRSPAMSLSAERPGFGIQAFDGGAFGPDGRPATQAGGHPDVTTDIEFTTALNAAGRPTPVGNLKDVTVDLPKGLIGNAAAAPKCSVPELNDPSNNAAQCKPETQVGVGRVVTGIGGAYDIAVYNVEPPPNAPARLAFNLYGVIVTLDPEVRTGGDYGITAHVRSSSQTLTVLSTRLTLWGVPADPSHDALRFHQGLNRIEGDPVPSTWPRKPFMTAPTECSGRPLVTSLAVSPWGDPSLVRTASFDHDLTGGLIRTENCGVLPFDPSFDVAPTSASKRGAPAGLRVDMTIPQNDNPDGLATAHLKKAVVTLPEGMVVNPSSAQGLAACTPEQIDIDGASKPTCPEASKIGSITAKSPVLDEPLTGGVYLASQNRNPFGTTLAMYLVLDGSGVLVKLPGRIDADPVTGRITATFDNNPQLPVEKLSMTLKTGPRAALSLPTTCGPATTTAVLTPWSGTAPVTLNTTFQVSHDGNGAPCPPMGFAPLFTAGAENPVGGADSPFTLGFSRTDEDQQFRGVSVTMPKGLLARISSTTQCDDAAASAGTCGDASKIGNVTTAAGAGSTPFSLPGRVYLTGPYKGAPFGLSIVVPAVAGPFNLGTVVVRAAINIDPIDAHVTVVSDPLPTILEGIPLQVRLVKVDVDRPGFTINPTSCATKSTEGVLRSVADATAAVSARFRLGDCGLLDLEPKLALSLSGKGQTTDGKHPAITATVTQKPGQANLKKVRVTLPLSLALDPDNANGLCEFVDGSKVTPTCPKASIVGTATATTPILGQPLSGPVYFVKNVRKDAKSGRDIKTLPKLVIPLVGENGLKLTLTGTSDVEDDQLVTTFDNIPDAPVSSFKLSINGGKGGILAVSGADICKGTQIADQQIDGQNNKQADTGVYIQTPSCPLKVLAKKVGKRSVAVKVGGLGAGKVTVTGKGIKKTTKTITKSTVATITAKRTKGKPGKVTVSYDPTGPAKARKITK